MPKLLVYDNKCQIVEELDVEVLRELDKRLSYFVQGAQHSKAYKGYVDKNGKFVKWDGFNRLLKNDLTFSAGHKNRVLNYYNSINRQIDVVDCRSSISNPNYIDISDNLKNINKIPYLYQIEAANKASNYDRGIIRLPTGSGKSLISALITSKLGKTTIIYVIGSDLLYQFHELFSSLFDQPIGIIGDGNCNIQDINIATVWTVGQAIGLKNKKIILDEQDKERKLEPEKYKDIRDMMLRTKVHILDECHLAACNTLQEISNRIKPEHVYGMSASPWRDDNSDLLIEGFLGDRIVDVPAKYLIDNNFLVPPTIKFLAVPKAGKIKKQYKTIYSKYIVENETRNNMVIKGAVKLIEQGYQTLVLFSNLKHGDILYDKLSKNINCALLSGKDNSDKRKKVKEDLESGKINCIVASKIFDIGIDLPSLSGLVVASGGKSSVRALQRIGRVIRRHPYKTNAAILDFVDQAPYLLKHSEIRKEIYSSEFDVIWPEKNRKK